MTRYFGSPAILSPNTVTALIAAPHGGWTQTQGPHGVTLAGYVYWANVNGTTGALEVAGQHLGGFAIAPITVHAALTSDTHDAPSLLIRASDHKLMVWYSGHNGTHFYQRISTNSLDSDPTLSGGFAAETDLASTFGGAQYTYPFAGQFADGTLWLGFRDNNLAFTQTWLCLAKSTDDGATWTAETKMWLGGAGLASSLYWMVHFGSDRFDMAISTLNGVTGVHASLYHAYWQGGGNPKQTNGASLGGTEPLSPTAATLVHDGSAYPNAWPSGMTTDATSAPVILYETLDTANGHAYTIKYARWNGASWDHTTITTLDDTGLVLVAHSALDEAGAIAWIVKPVSSVYEVFEYVTSDHGATWVATQLTSSSSSPGYVYPVNVHDPVTTIRGLVMGGGTYTSTVVNDEGTYGIGSP